MQPMRKNDRDQDASSNPSSETELTNGRARAVSINVRRTDDRATKVLERSKTSIPTTAISDSLKEDERSIRLSLQYSTPLQRQSLGSSSHFSNNKEHTDDSHASGASLAVINSVESQNFMQPVKLAETKNDNEGAHRGILGLGIDLSKARPPSEDAQAQTSSMDHIQSGVGNIPTPSCNGVADTLGQPDTVVIRADSQSGLILNNLEDYAEQSHLPTTKTSPQPEISRLHSIPLVSPKESRTSTKTYSSRPPTPRSPPSLFLTPGPDEVVVGFRPSPALDVSAVEKEQQREQSIMSGSKRSLISNESSPALRSLSLDESATSTFKRRKKDIDNLKVRLAARKQEQMESARHREIALRKIEDAKVYL